MRLTLVSPRIAIQKNDFLGSGIPYWPLELAVFAASLRDAGEEVTVLDLFGLDPRCLEEERDHYWQGVPLTRYLDTPATTGAEAFVVYAISFMSHPELLRIIGCLKRTVPATPVIVLENAQAVTAYALPRVADELFAVGADYLLCGDPCYNWRDVREAVRSGGQSLPSNLISATVRRPPVRLTHRGYHHPVPAWELFACRGYWALPYSHGPKTARFFPMLTSRGCPFACDFCVIPGTNSRRWIPNAPEDVVTEMLMLQDRMHVSDFQIEDLNPTVQTKRWGEIARLLLEKKADVHFGFVSGTKAETIPVDQVPLLAQAGCRFLSISPESGSSRLMQIIGKRFDYEHGAKLVQACRRHGIRTQACFLVGHPEETPEDFAASEAYLRRLVRVGLDEVGIFVTAPFAGSKLHQHHEITLADSGRMASFSPKGRANYTLYARRRGRLIRAFFAEKCKKGPNLWLQGWRALFGTPQTKMENLPKRILYVYTLIVRYKLKKLLGLQP